MDASTQTENISAISGILNMMLLFFIEEAKKERRNEREFNIAYSKEMDERYEEDIYNSYFYEDRIDILADNYRKNYDSQVKYTSHIYMDDFHRGKTSNAKKKSKRSVSCVPIPDAYDKQEEQNGYYDVIFSGDRVLYY